MVRPGGYRWGVVGHRPFTKVIALQKKGVIGPGLRTRPKKNVVGQGVER